LVNIATITLLLTDLEGAQALYEDLGDARAFAALHEHYRTLEQKIRQGGGALVKIVGEGILASFSESEAAVTTGLDLLDSLSVELRSRAIRPKVIIHRGPAMAATINDQLDYFGASVSQATRLLRAACGGEILISPSVASDPRVADLLRDRGLSAEVVPAELPGGFAHRLQSAIATASSSQR
jgi:class 3 adenylate cyclase